MRAQKSLVCLVLALGCGGSSSSTTTTTPSTTPSTPQVASAEALACPDPVLDSGKKQGGACMEPAVLGEDVVKNCVAYLHEHGWQHDDVVEKAIGERTHKTLVCYRAPGSDGP